MYFVPCLLSCLFVLFLSCALCLVSCLMSFCLVSYLILRILFCVKYHTNPLDVTPIQAAIDVPIFRPHRRGNRELACDISSTCIVYSDVLSLLLISNWIFFSLFIVMCNPHHHPAVERHKSGKGRLDYRNSRGTSLCVCIYMLSSLFLPGISCLPIIPPPPPPPTHL
jgi:hypothetical protein